MTPLPVDIIRRPAYRPPRLRWAVCRRLFLRASLIGLSAAVLLAACATPQRRKRSFMGQASRERRVVSEPAGLNPLGALPTCAGGEERAGQVPRVLVSRPEYFTEDASLMIVSLREALAQNEEGIEAPRMELSPSPILSEEDARGVGRRCGALIVLWEQGTSRTLELTLPFPARVPLRALVHRKLCEFGDHREQATILYFTILGLTAVARDNYDLAQFYLESARDIDVECMRLPGGALPAAPGAAGAN